MLNRIILIGRLTRDPELKTISNGIFLANFTLAVDRAFKKDEVDFINVVVWRQQAELCCKYLTKGKLAAVDGRLQIRSYEASDGSKRTASEVVADNVRFLSPKSEGEINNLHSNNNGIEEMPLDDLPF